MSKIAAEPERWLMAARLSRMSKRDRERGEELISGIQTQDQHSAAWAQEHGHVIIHVTRDRNVSGAVEPAKRPELGPWLTDPAKLAQYDGIVAYDVSRLSRDYEDVPWLRKWAERNGKKLYVIKERLHWPDDRDGMLWAVSAERAYQERQDIKERTGRERDALRAAGKYAGGTVPWGYAVEGEKYDRRLVPTPEGRRAIPELFRRAIAGDTLMSICRWLESAGYQPATGELWHPKTVSQMLRRKTYAGFQQDAEGNTLHRCEALVSLEDFERAGGELDKRATRGPATDQPALLAGLLRCATCDQDAPMYRIKCGKIFYYRCTGRGRHRKGCGNMIRLETLDAAVLECMSQSAVPYQDYQWVPGNDTAALRAELTAEFRGLDPLDPSQDDRRAELLAQIRAMPEATQGGYQPSNPDGTVGDHFRALATDEDRNAFIREYRFMAARQDGYVVLGIGREVGHGERRDSSRLVWKRDGEITRSRVRRDGIEVHAIRLAA